MHSPVRHCVELSYRISTCDGKTRGKQEIHLFVVSRDRGSEPTAPDASLTYTVPTPATFAVLEETNKNTGTYRSFYHVHLPSNSKHFARFARAGPRCLFPRPDGQSTQVDQPARHKKQRSNARHVHNDTYAQAQQLVLLLAIPRAPNEVLPFISCAITHYAQNPNISLGSREFFLQTQSSGAALAPTRNAKQDI